MILPLLVGLVASCTASGQQPEPPTTLAVVASSTATSLPAATPPSLDPTAPEQPPEAIAVVESEDYGPDYTITEAIDDIAGADGIIEATVVKAERCCENPPLQVTDIDVLAATESFTPRGDLHAQGDQNLAGLVAPGDRITLLLWNGTVQLAFHPGGSLLHPVPQATADALELMMSREAADTPLQAVIGVWRRYDAQLLHGTGSLGGIYLQGEPGFEAAPCSAADLGEVPLEEMELPAPVAATRANLVEAAAACDFAALIAMTGSDLPTDEFWEGATGSVHDLRVLDRDGALLQLVGVLAATEPERVESPDRESTPPAYYVWPAGAETADWRELSDPDLSLLSLLNEMTVPEFTAAWDRFGGYGLFRVGIAVDGTWLFARSGD
jgi:hypothetical protein